MRTLTGAGWSFAPITCALVKQPKQPGDDGSGWPGVFEPAGPKPPPIKTKIDVGRPATTAMAF